MSKRYFLHFILVILFVPSFGQTWDVDFGKNGIAAFDLGDGLGHFNTMIERSDTSLLTGGAFYLAYPNHGSLLPLARRQICWMVSFDKNGNPNQDFGQNGQLTFNLGGQYERVTQLHEDNQGRIWVAGISGNNIFWARFNPHGVPDSSYGVHGFTSFQFEQPVGIPSLKNFCIDENGNTYILGYLPARNRFFILKISKNGMPSSDFGENGFKWTQDTDFNPLGSAANIVGIKIQLLSNQHILLGGHFGKSPSSNNFFTKIDTIGKIDSTFGDQGFVVFSHENFGLLSDFQLLNDQQLLLTDKKELEAPVAKINLDGSLDSTFGSTGFLIPPNEYRLPNARLFPERLRVNKDGNILVHFFRNSQDQFIAQFDATGKPLTPFGHKGYVKINIENELGNLQEVFMGKSKHIQVLFDSKKVARYTTEGLLDPNLNQKGFFTFQPNQAGSAAFAIKQDKAGHILLGGATSRINSFDDISHYGFLAKFEQTRPQRALENSLEKGFEKAWIRDIQIDENDNILICGKKEEKAFLARLTSDGDIDRTFGQDGFVSLPVFSRPARYDELFQMAIQKDGKILAVGFMNDEAVVLRFQPSGLLDVSFGDNGHQFIAAYKANSVDILPDGRIHVVGSSIGKGFITRLHSNGTLDLSLAGRGALYTDFGASSGNAIGSAMSSDSTFVLVGHGDGFVAARYSMQGRLPEGFSVTGYYNIYFPNHLIRATRMLKCTDGSLLVIGKATNTLEHTNQIAIGKFLKSGHPDPQFGNDGGLILDLETKNEVPYDLTEIADSSILIAGIADGQSIVIKLLDVLHFEDPRPDYGPPFRHITLYPNPLQQEFNVSYFNFDGQAVRIRLLNSLGQEIAVLQDAERSFGTHEEELSLPDGLAPGFYLISLESKWRRQVIKIIVND